MTHLVAQWSILGPRPPKHKNSELKQCQFDAMFKNQWKYEK